MWKKIDTQAVKDRMTVGSVITDNADDPQDQYEIKSLHDGFVRAFHISGKVLLKIFPEEQLLNGTWWVKDKK
jgi:hypothetical protein